MNSDKSTHGALRYGALMLVPAVAGVGGAGWYLHHMATERDRVAELGAGYHDQALRQIDPHWLQWRETARLRTGIASLKGMALLPNGRVAVAGDKRVKIFDLRSISPTTSAAPPRHAPPEASPTVGAPAVAQVEFVLPGVPTALGADDAGRLLVALKDHVEVYSPTGERLSVWPTLEKQESPQGRAPWITCITVHGQQVYLADARRRIVVQCDMEGRVLRDFGRENEPKHARGLVVPSAHLDVALAGDGTIWIANPGRHQLEAYNAQGEVFQTWGQNGTTIEAFIGCCNPTDFALFADGRFVTAEKGVPRIKVYTPDGRLESVVAGPDSFAANAAGLDVATDTAGRVWVMDPALGAVRIYEHQSAAAGVANLKGAAR